MFPKDAPRSMKNRSSKMFMKSDDMTDSIHSFKRGGGGGLNSMFLLYNGIFSLGVSKTVYGMRKAVFLDYQSRFRTAKADFRLRKQISDYESRFLTAKGGFWSAKTGFGVRKRFLRQAGDFFLPALRVGDFFFP